LEALFENYLKSSIYFLKDFFEKDQVSKYYFVFNSNLCKLSCKGIFTKWFIKFSYAKGMFENDISKTIFVKFIL
jgi:hypothetical protein